MQDMLPFQGLRGICAMAIFLGHQTEMFLLSPWGGGQGIIVGLEFLQAVSLFFLLSGIPLSRLYSSRTTGKLETWKGCHHFWLKRFARLAPIYYLTLILNFVILFIICEQMDLLAATTSFVGCAILMQSWFPVSLINVGGVLWQVAVFAFGYLLFPFLSGRIYHWTDASLYGGILTTWLLSAALWYGFNQWIDPKGFGWWVWHVHCISRLPHFVAGVLLGEVLERKRGGGNINHRLFGSLTDTLSFLLLLTAIQAPIVQWYYGLEIRSSISIGLEAWLLPIHALWLAGIVLAYNQEEEELERCSCWTRRVLSFPLLLALGDVSLVLYCIHLVILFLYTSTYAYLTTGDARIAPSIVDYTLRVQTPWWHAPIHWILVISASFAVSKWFEAPLRKRIVATSTQNARTVPPPPTTIASAAPSEKTALVSST
uniref:Acyltransferase 3 domain-containing protein n=1 Tax=Ditylum brightwellii TaxID=49249 RepID=A0A6U3NN02_9STRA|mmetsp:Transcript_10822/g.16104  ORF Transcript_10822/g.16104 Transcript_10822/m.16104 type:complete len:428 (+) Transcript_10822:93-1376(+)